MNEYLGRGGNQTRPGDHTELLAEFRLLADFALSRVESMLATFAEGQEHANETSTSSDKSSAFDGCSWCPVCALAAAIKGEHHELPTVLAERVATVLALSREFLVTILDGPHRCPDGAVPTPDDPGSRQQRRTAFVPINVAVRH